MRWLTLLCYLVEERFVDRGSLVSDIAFGSVGVLRDHGLCCSVMGVRCYA